MSSCDWDCESGSALAVLGPVAGRGDDELATGVWEDGDDDVDAVGTVASLVGRRSSSRAGPRCLDVF